MAQTQANKRNPSGTPVHLTNAAARIILLSRMNRLSPTFFIERVRQVVGPTQTLMRLANKYFAPQSARLIDLVRQGKPMEFLFEILNAIQKADLVPIDFIDDVTDIDHPYFERIPFVPLGLDWDDYDPSCRELLPCVLINSVFHKNGESQSFFSETLVEAGYADLTEFSGLADNIRPDELIRCFKSRGPWKALPSLIRYALSCTGSNLLDVSYTNYAECSDPPAWEDFDAWVDEWKKYKSVYQKSWQLLNWIRKDEPARMKELSNILKEAAHVYSRKR